MISFDAEVPNEMVLRSSSLIWSSTSPRSCSDVPFGASGNEIAFLTAKESFRSGVRMQMPTI